MLCVSSWIHINESFKFYSGNKFNCGCRNGIGIYGKLMILINYILLIFATAIVRLGLENLY